MCVLSLDDALTNINFFIFTYVKASLKFWAHTHTHTIPSIYLDSKLQWTALALFIYINGERTLSYIPIHIQEGILGLVVSGRGIRWTAAMTGNLWHRLQKLFIDALDGTRIWHSTSIYAHTYSTCLKMYYYLYACFHHDNAELNDVNEII